MRAAFAFPGQGARGLLSGLETALQLPDGPRLLALAGAESGRSLAQLQAQGGRALEHTEVQQPVLVAVSLAVASALTAGGFLPAVVLGHSLGELAAWSLAGAFDAEAAVRLAAGRGRAMARAAEAHPGGLLALRSPLDLARALELGRPAGGLEVAAWNGPEEVVLSGPEAALRAAAAGVQARRVPVAGPWHSRAMAEAEGAFRAQLEAACPRPARLPVLGNRDGLLAPPDACVTWLSGQLTRPVHFQQAAATLAGLRPPLAVVTVGPAAVLRALLRANLGTEATVLTTEDLLDLARTRARLEEP